MISISSDTTIYELIQSYPELQSVLASIGFTEISKPLMLQTVGRIMTLRKGCILRNIDLEDCIIQLEAYLNNK